MLHPKRQKVKCLLKRPPHLEHFKKHSYFNYIMSHPHSLLEIAFTNFERMFLVCDSRICVLILILRNNLSNLIRN